MWACLKSVAIPPVQQRHEGTALCNVLVIQNRVTRERARAYCAPPYERARHLREVDRLVALQNAWIIRYRAAKSSLRIAEERGRTGPVSDQKKNV
jgi:hypothetical protein